MGKCWNVEETLFDIEIVPLKENLKPRQEQLVIHDSYFSLYGDRILAILPFITPVA